MTRTTRVLAMAVVAAWMPVVLPAQQPAPENNSARLDALVEHALEASPTIAAARARVDAARSAIAPAGALPDPMVSLGIANLPITDARVPAHGDPDDSMTMKMIGVGQTFTYPGKLGLRRRVAEEEFAAAEASLDAASQYVRERVQIAYYELAYLDQAIEIVNADQALLMSFVEIAEARYGVGTGDQQDALEARLELARLAHDAVAISEQRSSVLAGLNALLDRPTETPVDGPNVPERIARAAAPNDAAPMRFVSAGLGSRAADSPFPPLVELQERAVRENQTLRSHEAMVRAQVLRVDLARKEHLPDFDVSLQYGQRSGYPDMVSAMVSVPVPLRRRQRQDFMVEEAEAVLSTLEAEHHDEANALRADVAAAYADVERERARLALFVGATLPQGTAVLESAAVSFQVGRGDLLELLEHQSTVHGYETEYHRTLSDFAIRLAELERLVGGEILP